MKTLTDMTIEELAIMRAALCEYFDSRQDVAFSEMNGKSLEEQTRINDKRTEELALINGLIRTIDEAETEWKKHHTINWRTRLRQRN